MPETYEQLLHQRDKLRMKVGELEARLRVLTGPVAQDANRYRELRSNHLDFAVTMPRKSGFLAYFGEALDLKVDESIRRGLDTARVLREEPDHG